MASATSRAESLARGLEPGHGVAGWPVCFDARPCSPVLRLRRFRSFVEQVGFLVEKTIQLPAFAGGRWMAAGLLGHASAEKRKLFGQVGICPPKPCAGWSVR